MAENIVPSQEAIVIDWQKEFKIGADGSVTGSRRGTARLCGVQTSSITYLLKTIKNGVAETLPKPLKSFAGQDFDGVVIPDVLISAIISYYARKGVEQAQDTQDLMVAVGLRSFVHDKLGYKPARDRQLTAAEIIEICCLPVPTTWQRQFPEEYYEHLSRLTRLVCDGSTRPLYWAALTKELVYDYLPKGIYSEIKRCKSETGSYEKLHQFLSPDGIDVLRKHLERVLHHMQGAASIGQLKTALSQACSQDYQLLLFG